MAYLAASAQLRSVRRGIVATVVGVGLALLSAHEGHEGVAPEFREIDAGGVRWQVGLGVVPPDPVAGEAFRMEVKATTQPQTGDGAATPASLAQVRVRVDGAPVALHATNTAGVFEGSSELDAPGAHGIGVELGAEGGAPVTVAFPLRVEAGQAPRIRTLVLGGFLALLVGAGWVFGSDVQERWGRSGAPQRAILVIVAVAVVGAVVPASRALSEALARAFRPERPEMVVDWIPEGSSPAPAASTASPDSQGHEQDHEH